MDGIPARRLALLVALLALLTPSPGAHAAVPVIAIDGKGLGHGVGMPQDGALALARARASTDQILGRFYPGTKTAKATGTVRVGVAEAGGPAGHFVLSFPSGGEVRDARDGAKTSGFPLHVGKGGAIAVAFDGARYQADIVGTGHAMGWRWTLAAHTVGPLDTTSTTAPLSTPTTRTPTTTTTSPTTTTTHSAPPAAPTPTSASSDTPLWAVPPAGADVIVTNRVREYRGAIEAIAAGGGFRLVNEVDVEDYLRGMGEVRDPSWPAAGLEAQAVAARTYALRAARAGLRPEGFHLFDDDRSQVYLGRAAEYAAMDRAVSHTRGKVLTFDGALAATVYSASAGGITATAPEGFGPAAPDRPYLPATKYDTGDARAWHVSVAPDELAARVGYHGPLRVVAVSKRGPSGRATEVTLEGPAGSMTIDGTKFAAAVGLRSTLFDLGFAESTVPPPPLPAPIAQQQLPEGGPVTEAAATAPAPIELPWHGAPISTRGGRLPAGPQRGPLPPAVATSILLLITWGLVSRTSELVARANATFVAAARATGRWAQTRPRHYGV